MEKIITNAFHNYELTTNQHDWEKIAKSINNNYAVEDNDLAKSFNDFANDTNNNDWKKIAEKINNNYTPKDNFIADNVHNNPLPITNIDWDKISSAIGNTYTASEDSFANIAEEFSQSTSENDWNLISEDLEKPVFERNVGKQLDKYSKPITFKNWVELRVKMAKMASTSNLRKYSRAAILLLFIGASVAAIIFYNKNKENTKITDKNISVNTKNKSNSVNAIDLKTDKNVSPNSNDKKTKFEFENGTKNNAQINLINKNKLSNSIPKKGAIIRDNPTPNPIIIETNNNAGNNSNNITNNNTAYPKISFKILDIVGKQISVNHNQLNLKNLPSNAVLKNKKLLSPKIDAKWAWFVGIGNMLETKGKFGNNLANERIFNDISSSGKYNAPNLLMWNVEAGISKTFAKHFEFRNGIAITGTESGPNNMRNEKLWIYTDSLPYRNKSGDTLFWLGRKWKEKNVTFTDSRKETWAQIPIQFKWKTNYYNRINFSFGINSNIGFLLSSKTQMVNVFASNPASYWQYNFGINSTSNKDIISINQYRNKIKLQSGVNMGISIPKKYYLLELEGSFNKSLTDVWKRNAPYSQKQQGFGLNAKLVFKM